MKDFCRRWQRNFAAHLPHLTMRRNTPYRGVSDSLTAALRLAFPEDAYLSLELRGPPGPRRLRRRAVRLETTLAETLK